MQGGRVFLTKRSPKGWGGRKQIPAILPEPCNADAAAAWNEGYQLFGLYPVRNTQLSDFT
jgi:hypothetical protein